MGFHSADTTKFTPVYCFQKKLIKSVLKHSLILKTKRVAFENYNKALMDLNVNLTVIINKHFVLKAESYIHFIYEVFVFYIFKSPSDTALVK